ncbi:MAG TPA: glycoside hydrolase family 99-like domain-containing protein [Candidatus Sulfotelmatobacter sp.]|jgi:hypothetical protein|nr:glycoside hydrolase family 99-like domain-containing protein [Candidatus Sulfotelmatobacter sp.]
MSVRVLAFFDTRYQPALAGGADPWKALRDARAPSRLHFALDQPSTLGMYDLSERTVAAQVVLFARNAGVDGFVVDVLWDEARKSYQTGAEPLAIATGESFGLAFQWRNGPDAFWQAPASVEARQERAAALVGALKVGHPALMDGRLPLVVKYPKLVWEPAETLALLRREAEAAGLPGLYLIACRAEDRDGKYTKGQGYDALIDPGPAEWQSCPPSNNPSGLDYLEVMAGLRDSVEYLDRFYDYPLFAVARMINRDQRGKVLARVFPGYFDWQKHPEGGAMHLVNRKTNGTQPVDRHLYGLFFENAMLWTRNNIPPDERVVFLDSWNGWLTGSQVEPSLMEGDLVYNATRAAIDRARYVIKGRDSAPEAAVDAAMKERIALLVEAAKNF